MAEFKVFKKVENLHKIFHTDCFIINKVQYNEVLLVMNVWSTLKSHMR